MNTAELKKLIERITQGKWILSENINDTQDKPFREFCVEGENGEEIIGFFTNAANAEAIALLPKLLRENEQLKLQNEKFESLLYQISRSVCLDQKLSGKCLCFSCEAKAALGEK